MPNPLTPPTRPLTTTTTAIVYPPTDPRYGPVAPGIRPGMPQGGVVLARELTVNAEETPPESGRFVGEVRDNARPGWVWRSPRAMPSHTAALAIAQAHAIAIRDGLRHDGLTLDQAVG